MRSARAAADMCMGMEINPKVRWPFQTVLAMWTLLRQQAGTLHELFKISRQRLQESRRILGRWFISQLNASWDRKGRTMAPAKVWDRMPSWPNSKNISESDASTRRRTL